MKKLLLLILLIPASGRPQFNLQPRVGLNENAHAIFAMGMAYRVGALEPAFEITDVQHNTEAAYFNFRIGFIVPVNESTNIMGIAGQTFRYMSNDKLNDNKWFFYPGLRVEKHLNCMFGKSAIFLQTDYLKQWQFTLGVKI